MVKNLLANARNAGVTGSILGLGRCPGGGNGNPLQCSCLENPRDGGAWWAAVHGVARSRTRLSDFTFTFHFHALEKEMATHSSILAWRIPGMGEPGGLPSMGSQSWTRLKRLSSSSTLPLGQIPKSRNTSSENKCMCSFHRSCQVPLHRN